MNPVEPFWLIVTIALSFGISLGMVPVIIKIANQRKIADRPDTDRKIHSVSIPTLGGIAVFMAILIPFSASEYAAAIEGFGILTASLLILFAVGLIDDLIGLAAVEKLYAQIVAVGLTILAGGVYITFLNGFLGIYEIPGWSGMLLTLLLMISIINGFNFIDGIDGLASTLGILICFFFGLIFYSAGLMHLAVLSWVTSAALAGFLWHNRPPAIIFMGDTGSLTVGFLIAWLSVNLLIASPEYHPALLGQPFTPALLIAILIIPLYDFLRIFLLRLFKGKSPLNSDKNHIHHIVLDLTGSQKKVILIIAAVNLVFVALYLILAPLLSDMLVVILLLVLAALTLPTFGLKTRILSRES